MNKVKQAVLNSGTIQPDMNIVLGLSGGPDSLTLLHVLNELKQDMNLNIIPVHVNHKLRENADKEQEHVEHICESMGLKCNSLEFECGKMAEEMKVSEEEAGRIARYQIFSQIADSIFAQLDEDDREPDRVVIAVAHNADDQSETVLFRIIRGTGIHGIIGIRPVRLDEENHLIVRPLLSVTREEIEAYIKKNRLKPNYDETNDIAEATRNKIRLELLPYIEKNINPNVKENLRRLADTAVVDDDFLELAGEEAYELSVELDTSDNALVLNIEEVADMHLAIIRRVIANILKSFGLEQDINYNIINGIIDVMFSDNPSAAANLPQGLVCERRYGDLVFRLPPEEGQAREEISEQMRLITQVIHIDEFKGSENPYAAFDFAKFNEKYPGNIGKIEIRTREKGDYIAMSGGKRKKLQDFFVDSKIHKSMRDKLPVVAIGDEVLWIPPHACLSARELREKGKYSQNYQIDDTSNEVLFLEIVRPL